MDKEKGNPKIKIQKLSICMKLCALYGTHFTLLFCFFVISIFLALLGTYFYTKILEFDINGRISSDIEGLNDSIQLFMKQINSSTEKFKEMYYRALNLTNNVHINFKSLYDSGEKFKEAMIHLNDVVQIQMKEFQTFYINFQKNMSKVFIFSGISFPIDPPKLPYSIPLPCTSSDQCKINK